MAIKARFFAGRNSQISVEYMILIGFVSVIIIPLIIVYHSFTQESGDEINSVQLLQIAKNIVDAAESVYYLGEPSQTTLRVNIPSQVASVNLSGKEVSFKLKTKSGEVDIAQSSAVNITGSLPTNKSIYLITIKAKANYVEVSYK